MVPERVKVELKRFMKAKQVEELSRQLDTYEQRVREAVKTFDVKGREARVKGQEQLDKFALQVKKTGQELERQFKDFVNQEGKVLTKGLDELFTYFKGITKQEAKAKSPVQTKRSKAASKKKPAAKKSASRKKTAKSRA